MIGPMPAIRGSSTQPTGAGAHVAVRQSGRTDRLGLEGECQLPDPRASRFRSGRRRSCPWASTPISGIGGKAITPYVERAKGAYLWDVDGRRFIDYRMAFGPIILGHAFDDIDAAGDRGTATRARCTP